MKPSTLQILPLTQLSRTSEDRLTDVLRKLEPYFGLFPEDMLQSQVDVWRDRASYLLQPETEISTLLFCLSDGLKVLLMRGRQEVYLVVMRSALDDRSYQKHLASFTRREPSELGERFAQVPLFGLKTVPALRQAFAANQIGTPVDASWKELDTLVEWYGKQKGSTYALDIRVFAVMRALRQVFCDLALHLVLIQRLEPGCDERALTRLYVYQTEEVVPQRPPIYACRATKIQSLAVQAAREAHESVVGPEDSFVARAAQRIGCFRFKAPIHVFVFESADSCSTALLEISGAAAGAEDIALARRAIEAAIEPTDDQAIEQLAKCALLATPRQVRDFNRLLFIFSHGLSSAQGSETEADRAWANCLDTLRDAVGSLPSGCLSLEAKSHLFRLVESFRTNGNRERFDSAAFESGIAELKEKIATSRSSIRLLPRARITAPL